MATLNQVSHQWMTRPDDQRFVSLLDMQAAMRAYRQNSVARVVPSNKLRAVPDVDNRGLLLQGPNGGDVDVSHWAFGQLAQRSGAPAGYLRDLPAPLAADCINYGLSQRDISDVGVLLTRYGRIWNSTIVDALIQRFGDGITGDFRVPGEFGQHVDVTKANTTLYASDRDMFVFLCDERNRIDMPNRRDGQPGSLARGFIVWNSQVGSATFGVTTMLFDYVCRNRIIWGAEGVQEFRVRHTASAPERWIHEVAPAIEAYAQSSASGITAAVTHAQHARIDNLDTFLAQRFTKAEIAGARAPRMRPTKGARWKRCGMSPRASRHTPAGLGTRTNGSNSSAKRARSWLSQRESVAAERARLRHPFPAALSQRYRKSRMTQKPLTEDEAARRILESVPASLRSEVAKSLRAIQLTNWLAGWTIGASRSARADERDEGNQPT